MILKRTVSLLLAALLLCAALSACGEQQAGVKTDVAAADIAGRVMEALGTTETMTDISGVVVERYMNLDPAALGDCAVRHNSFGSAVDEFGVFKAGTMSAAELKAAAEAYFTMLRETSMIDMYTPEEKPKLDNAEVRVVGDYVMYAVLSDTDRATAFRAFEDALKS